MKHKKEEYGYGGAYIDEGVLSWIALVGSVIAVTLNVISLICR